MTPPGTTDDVDAHVVVVPDASSWTDFTRAALRKLRDFPQDASRETTSTLVLLMGAYRSSP